jgi:hypothetical protein
VPSPSRKSKSSSGFNPKCFSAIVEPGSDEVCAAIRNSVVFGFIAFATVAAASVMTPSNTTGICSDVERSM